MWVAEDGVYVAVLDDSNSDWDGMGWELGCWESCNFFIAKDVSISP